MSTLSHTQSLSFSLADTTPKSKICHAALPQAAGCMEEAYSVVEPDFRLMNLFFCLGSMESHLSCSTKLVLFFVSFFYGSPKPALCPSFSFSLSLSLSCFSGFFPYVSPQAELFSQSHIKKGGDWSHTTRISHNTVLRQNPGQIKDPILWSLWSKKDCANRS